MPEAGTDVGSAGS